MVSFTQHYVCEMLLPDSERCLNKGCGSWVLWRDQCGDEWEGEGARVLDYASAGPVGMERRG